MSYKRIDENEKYMGVKSMRSNAVASVLAFTMLAVYSAICFAAASTIDSVRVLKISGSDARAVIRDAFGKTIVLKPGDAVGTNARVTEIAVDRIVIEEKTSDEPEKVIIRFINGAQKVERISKKGESLQPTYMSSDLGSKAAK
jgi:hypothetical protein